MSGVAGLQRRLAAGAVVVIDGGTGTEIQRRGAAMDSDTWCAEANRTAPEVVADVHRAYVEAGAEVIIANTFATSPLLFSHAGRGAEVADLDRRAVALAREAADGRVPVAASISTMRPVLAGSDRNQLAVTWPEAEVRRLYEAKATTLVAAGAEVLVMEMMRDTDYARWATEAALATGVPVWVGVSVERDGPDGRLVGWGRPDCPAEAVIDGLAALGPDLMAVMHSSVADTGPALDLVRARFAGPIGAYPESGHFTMPDWVFADLTPAELVDAAAGWVAAGAGVVGGCCGIAPVHIAALAAAAPAWTSGG